MHHTHIFFIQEPHYFLLQIDLSGDDCAIFFLARYLCGHAWVDKRKLSMLKYRDLALFCLLLLNEFPVNIFLIGHLGILWLHDWHVVAVIWPHQDSRKYSKLKVLTSSVWLKWRFKKCSRALVYSGYLKAVIDSRR